MTWEERLEKRYQELRWWIVEECMKACKAIHPGVLHRYRKAKYNPTSDPRVML